LTIKGTGGTRNSAYTFLGLGLTRPVEAQGNFEAFGARSFTDDQANWTDDQFNGANGQYYLEVTSGPYAGLTTDIVATDAATKTLTTSDDFSGLGLAGGTTYRIRKHWTLASLFGPHNEAGLGGGISTTADEIMLFDPSVSAYITYYYLTVGTPGWRLVTDPQTDQANARINPAQGFIIKRKQPNDITVKLFGAVKLGDTAVIVKTGANVVGNIYPTDTLTLGNSRLYTGNPVTGLAGGTSTTADQVMIFNGDSYDTYYYLVLGTFPIGWRAANDATTDVSGTPIRAGSSIVIKRNQGRSDFIWFAPQPF
jgi:uncharacterized protein (TIGR02597 family)